MKVLIMKYISTPNQKKSVESKSKYANSLKKIKCVEKIYSQFDLIQSCSAGARNFTKYVFFHVQFGGLVQNSQNYCAISVKFKKKRFFTL